MTRVQEPAEPGEPLAADEAERAEQTEALGKLDPRKLIYVYDTTAKGGAQKNKLPFPVPETHLAIFPHLAQVPSDKENK